MKLTLPETLTGRHVLVMIVAFFVVVIGVNLSMVFLALDSWSGLSTDDPYQRGLRYNKTLEAMAHRDALGWRESLGFTPGADVKGEPAGRISVEMRDREGNLLEGLVVSGQIRRPIREGFDREVTLTAVSAGRYEADVAFPLRGNWLVRLTARHDPNRHDLAATGNAEHAGFAFGMEKRIEVP
jgi:nitrogen fixation protein FixH